MEFIVVVVVVVVVVEGMEAEGQQTNSTPEKTPTPHGKSIAYDCNFIPLFRQETDPVLFQKSGA
jgi:hypothetical protein